VACLGVGHLEVLDCFGATVDTCLQDGTAEVTGTPALFVARLEDVTAELAYGLLGCHVQQEGRLGVEVADRAVFVDGIDAFDHNR